MPRARRQMRRRNVAQVAVGSAVVAGTAGAVHHHQNKRWAKKEQEQQMVEEQAQYIPPSEPVPAQEDDTISQLERLGALYTQGILTEEEFAAQKAIILGT